MNYSAEEHIQIVAAVDRCGSINKAAIDLQISRWKAQQIFKEATNGGIERPQIVSPDITIEELKRRRFEDFNKLRVAANQEKMIDIRVNEFRPFGVALIGDPHTDNEGTNLEKLYGDAETIRDTDGLYAINVGDNNDLWTRRLSHLYAKSRTTERDGWRLTQDLLETIGDKWLALMMGNHDLWGGDRDILKWFMEERNWTSSGYDLRLRLVMSAYTYRIWLRHDFAGHSMWNKLHALVKARKFSKMGFDLLVCGHRHESGEYAEYDPEDNIFWRAIRTCGYKEIDEYATACQYMSDAALSCPVVIIDPNSSNPIHSSFVVPTPQIAATILDAIR